jgi:hypothetical protein
MSGTVHGVSDVPDPALRHLAIEHAMRICNDEVSVLCLAEAAPRSPTLLVALGRLLSSGATLLTDRSPLVLWATGAGELDAAWRDRLIEHPDSLWSRLEFLEVLWCEAPDGEGHAGEHPLDRLLRLEDAAESEL